MARARRRRPAEPTLLTSPHKGHGEDSRDRRAAGRAPRTDAASGTPGPAFRAALTVPPPQVQDAVKCRVVDRQEEGNGDSGGSFQNGHAQLMVGLGAGDAAAPERLQAPRPRREGL